MKRITAYIIGIGVGIVLLLCLNFSFKVYTINPIDQTPADHSFRIMTYNVNFKLSPDLSSSDTTSLIQIIREQNPDILCLEELLYNKYKLIKDSLDNYFCYSNEQKRELGSNRYALYSKLPIRNYRQHNCIGDIVVPEADSISDNWVSKFKDKMPVFSADIEIEPGKWVTVFSCHLRSNDYSVARKAIKSDSASWIDGIPLYSKNYNQGKAIRYWQAQTIRHHVDSLLFRNIPVIVAGGLNDFCGSDCLDMLMYGKGQTANVESQMTKGDSELRDAWETGLRDKFQNPLIDLPSERNQRQTLPAALLPRGHQRS